MSMTEQNLFLLTEAAERTGLSVDALRQRVKRGKLEAVKGNDGLVRVRLTSADLEAIRPTAAQTATIHALDESRKDNALADAVAAFGEEQARMRAERDAALAKAEERAEEIAELRERLGRAEGEALVLREQMKAERERSQALEAQRDAARAELEAWGAGGPLARAWRAFTSRRGRDSAG